MEFKKLDKRENYVKEQEQVEKWKQEDMLNAS